MAAEAEPGAELEGAALRETFALLVMTWLAGRVDPAIWGPVCWALTFEFEHTLIHSPKGPFESFLHFRQAILNCSWEFPN